MADIALPLDHRDPVVLLPESQNPFGPECTLERRAQSVFFHHDCPKDDVLKFLAAVGSSTVSVRIADPDSSDGKSLFSKATEGMSVGSVHKLRLTVRRLGNEDPFASLRAKRSSSTSVSSAFPSTSALHCAPAPALAHARFALSRS